MRAISIIGFVGIIGAAFGAGAAADEIVERISPLTVSSKIVRLDLYDDDGVGDINVDFHYELSTNNSEAVSLGTSKRVVVLKMEGTRSTIANAIVAIRDASLVVNDGGWPEAAIALPRPRKNP